MGVEQRVSSHTIPANEREETPTHIPNARGLALDSIP